MYYSCKIKYQFPKPDGDDMQKKSESYLVFAESCTEAEGKMIDWMPANFQDSEVIDVKKTSIGELRFDGKSESFWLVKILDDLDGTSDKVKPYLIVYDGDNLEDAVRKCGKDFSSDMENVSRFKVIIDEDLISQSTAKIVKKVVQPVSFVDEEMLSEDE